MRLITFGDSWPFGHRRFDHNLVDSEGGSHVKSEWKFVEKPFPILLAEKLGITYRNYAKTGNSNFVIALDIFNYLNTSYREGDRILIVWTEWPRMSIRNEHKLSGIEPEGPQKYGNRFAGIPNGFNRLGHYPELCDTTGTLEDFFYQRLQGIMAYHTVRDMLNQRNIPYRQINSLDHSGFYDHVKVEKTRPNKSRPSKKLNLRKMYYDDDPNWIEVGSDYNTLLDICTDQWLSEGKKQDSMDYLRWCKNICTTGKFEPYLNTACMHPNEEGHELITEVLLPYIKKLIEE